MSTFSWYSKYRGRSVGRILHALNFYTTLHIAERATVGKEEIHFPENNLFATFTWEGDTDIPIITFVGENKEKWQKEQTAKKPFLDDFLGYLKSKT